MTVSKIEDSGPQQKILDFQNDLDFEALNRRVKRELVRNISMSGPIQKLRSDCIEDFLRHHKTHTLAFYYKQRLMAAFGPFGITFNFAAIYLLLHDLYKLACLSFKRANLDHLRTSC